MRPIRGRAKLCRVYRTDGVGASRVGYLLAAMRQGVYGSPMSMPVWISEAQALSAPLTAFGALAVAVFAARISYLQARTAQRKLRLDMFPFRFAVYNVVVDSVVVALNREHKDVFDEKTRVLNLKVRESRFLFSSDVFSYISNVETKVLQVRNGNLMESEAYLSDPNLLAMYHDDQQFLVQSLQELASKLESPMKLDDTLSFSLLPER